MNEEMQQRIIPAVTKQPECILEAMELISESADDSHLSDEFFKAVELPARYLADRLQITPLQSVLFSLLMDRSEDSHIHLSDIAEATGCSTTRMLRLSSALDELARRFYIRIRKKGNSDTYRVPREVIMSLRDDAPFVHESAQIADVNEFFDAYGMNLSERKTGEISYEIFIRLNEENLEQISDTHFAKTIRREIPEEDDRLLFVHMAYLYISEMDDFIGFHEINQIYDDCQLHTLLKKELRSGNSTLQCRLIENSNHDGMAVPDRFRLTDYAKKEVLKEVAMTSSTNTSHHLTKYDALPEKNLIYNEREREQIGELSSLLMPERFKEIQDNLEAAGMRRGFCCLFYGAPGTGKTETVYQIARLTGRDIMQVNVDEIKSCWVGDSEKNIKNVFDRYRNICEDCRTAPILLFNEADAILGLRMEGAIRGVDKMENSIQNIILQEMESLGGIMIATTNLTSNLDKAFERRFLYKVRFEKPTPEARCGIWMQMLGGLTQEDARLLATRFDLSGGEIENIARKHSVSAILHGSELVDIKAISKMCELERIESASHRRVGF